ncbi:MAG TPA: hypothetical protein VI011_10295 [Asanoa sp.]
MDPAAADGERDITAVAGRHHQGVRFRYAGRPYYWFTGFLTSMLLLMLGLAALFATSGAVAGIVFAVVIGAAAALLGWLLVTALRLASGEVTVSPVGVFHRGPTFVHFVPWYAVDAVDARGIGSPVVVVRSYPAQDTVVRNVTGRIHTGELTYLPLMVVRSYWLGTDPTTVYHALAYHHAHVDRGPELATPAAIDRINSGTATLAH